MWESYDDGRLKHFVSCFVIILHIAYVEEYFEIAIQAISVSSN